MTYQELCELADREIRLGLHDRVLMKRALEEAVGVTAHAQQIYWRLRATALQEEAKRFPAGGEELYLREVRARLEAEGRRRKSRADVAAWLWVVACFAGLVGAFIFFRAASAAFFRGGAEFYGFAVSGFLCLVVAIAGYVVAKRDAGQDPFSD
jgi:hypothetical protein